MKRLSSIQVNVNDLNERITKYEKPEEDKAEIKKPKTRVYEYIEIDNKNTMEKSNSQYLNTLVTQDSKNNFNISQVETIQNALDYNAYLINKLNGKAYLSSTRETQFELISLFDNLEKLTSNCVLYKNKFHLKKHKTNRKKLGNLISKFRPRINTNSRCTSLYISKFN